MRPAAADRLPEPSAGETSAPAARREAGSFLARVRDRALAAVGGRTRSALLALGLAAAGAGAARAEDAARIEAPTAAGAKVEMVAGTPDSAPAGIVLAMARNAPVAGNEGGKDGHARDVREPAPYAQEAARTSDAVVAGLQERYRGDAEMEKLLAELRAAPGSLVQKVRDHYERLRKDYPLMAEYFRKEGVARDVFFWDRLIERPGDLMDPMDRPAPDGLPELAAPVSELFPDRLFPVTEANLGEFLDWTANKVRFTKAVVVARATRGDWAYVDDQGNLDKDNLRNLRWEQHIAAVGGKDAYGKEKVGYEKRLRADPKALAAYLAAINKSVGAVREKGGGLPVNWPGKLAFHLATAALVGSGAVDADKMSDADLFQLSDEFGFLVQAAAMPGARHPVATLAFVSRPDAAMVAGVAEAAGPGTRIAQDLERSTLPVGSEPGSPLHIRYQAQFAWENAPALLSAAAARGDRYRLAESKALRTVAGQARMVNAYVGELDRATAEGYGLAWTPAMEAAAKAAPRGALRHVVATVRLSDEDFANVAKAEESGRRAEEGAVIITIMEPCDVALEAWLNAPAADKPAKAKAARAAILEARAKLQVLPDGHLILPNGRLMKQDALARLAIGERAISGG